MGNNVRTAVVTTLYRKSLAAFELSSTGTWHRSNNKLHASRCSTVVRCVLAVTLGLELASPSHYSIGATLPGHRYSFHCWNRHHDHHHIYHLLNFTKAEKVPSFVNEGSRQTDEVDHRSASLHESHQVASMGGEV